MGLSDKSDSVKKTFLILFLLNFDYYINHAPNITVDSNTFTIIQTW